MIFHYDIEQKTDEWHEVKFGKIGGTRAGVGKDTLIHTLLSEHLEDFEPSDEGFLSSAMERGNDLEPIARNLLFTETFVDFKECGWIQSEENELLGISPDGISEDETIMCEIKCPASKKYIDQLLTNDILTDYVDQLVHAFLVNDKLKTHIFAMYRPENKIKPIWYKSLTKDSEVNVGTAKKPVIRTIGEQVEIKRKEAKEVLESLKTKINKLKGISEYDDKILVVDIETTGFLPNGKIVEVGIVELCLNTGDRKIIYDKIFNPKLPKEEIDSSWIVQNKYMTTEDILNGSDILESISEIQNIVNLYQNGLTAYNRSFDVDFLKSVGIEFGELLPCPMLLSTDICEIPSPRGYGFKWPKVQEAYDFFFPNSGYEELHRGADDALHEAEIVYKLHTLNKLIKE